MLLLRRLYLRDQTSAFAGVPVTMPAKWQCRVCCNAGASSSPAYRPSPTRTTPKDLLATPVAIGRASAVGPANVIALTLPNAKTRVGMEPMLEKGKVDRSWHDQQPALATYHIAHRISVFAGRIGS